MSRLNSWLIRKLGGVPVVEHTDELRRYEAFGRALVKRLAELGATVPKTGEVIRERTLGDLIISECFVVISGCEMEALYLAPWASYGLVTDCHIGRPHQP